MENIKHIEKLKEFYSEHPYNHKCWIVMMLQKNKTKNKTAWYQPKYKWGIKQRSQIQTHIHVNIAMSEEAVQVGPEEEEV